MSGILLTMLISRPVLPKVGVVYIAPHQDDEVLTYGPSILADVAAGLDVHVVLATRGQSSGVRTSPTIVNRVGYTPSIEQFSAARDLEFSDAVYRLGATPVILPYLERQSDGGSTASGVEQVVRSAFPAGADLVCGISPSDPHNDHANTGLAAQALRTSGWATNVRLHVAYYNKNAYSGPPLLTRGPAMTRFYQNPYIEHNVANGRWGVGYVSVPTLFDGQLLDPLSYIVPD